MNYKEKDWLYQKYWGEKLSMLKIAELCDVNSQTILNWLRRFKIKTRTLSEASKLLPNNGGTYKKGNIPWIKGKKHSEQAKRKLSKYRMGKRSGNWKGGRRLSNGYVFILKKDHPRATSDGYVAEHRLVLEKVLGRYLNQEETPHHINGIKNDNRPENLQLFSSHGPHLALHNTQRRQ